MAWSPVGHPTPRRRPAADPAGASDVTTDARSSGPLKCVTCKRESGEGVSTTTLPQPNHGPVSIKKFPGSPKSTRRFRLFGTVDFPPTPVLSLRPQGRPRRRVRPVPVRVDAPPVRTPVSPLGSEGGQHAQVTGTCGGRTEARPARIPLGRRLYATRPGRPGAKGGPGSDDTDVEPVLLSKCKNVPELLSSFNRTQEASRHLGKLQVDIPLKVRKSRKGFTAGVNTIPGG